MQIQNVARLDGPEQSELTNKTTKLDVDLDDDYVCQDPTHRTCGCKRSRAEKSLQP